MRSPFLFVALVVCVVTPACQCSKPPVTEAQRKEGEPCGADEECETGLCDHLPGEPSVCLRKCSAGCDPTDVCNALATMDRYACLPERKGLCLSCTSDIDCAYPGDKCLSIGGVSVCGRDCSFDGQCPSSYRCADGTAPGGGAVSRQCQPVSGTCECIASTAGQTIPCEETNNLGTCVGVQTCHPPGGFDACSARVPSEETCNALDDDCNGQTDENLGETTCGTGECRRTVSNCINGAPQTCAAGTPGTEVCDERDNDCDGVVDDGFDKLTSLTNCGGCGVLCERVHATPVCDLGACRIGACDPGWVNANGIDSDGCEYACTPTGAELCDGFDNDCDGQIDEDFVLQTDPLNCGMCGRVCSVPNGHVMTYGCTAGNCTIAACTSGFHDCDVIFSTGCEKPTDADVNNCGACNAVCTAAHATPVCVNSACGIGSCDPGWGNCNADAADGGEANTTSTLSHCGQCNAACPSRANATSSCANSSCGYACNTGWVDLDHQAINGCEYQCTALGTDVPDLGGVDLDCDGIDGNELTSVFVDATAGNDANPGTKTAPKRTVGAGLAAAQGSGKNAVLVSEGTYVESLTLVSNVGIFGGYRASAGWSRPTGATTRIEGGPRAVVADGLTGALELQKLNIASAAASGTGGSGEGTSSSAVSLRNAGTVVVRGCLLQAGPGAPADQTVPSPGSPGAPGDGGGAGTPGALGGAPGAGGASSCGVPGGSGGAGKLGIGNNPNTGNAGGNGTAVPGGGAASPGSAGGQGGQCDNQTQPNVTSGVPVTPSPAGSGGTGAPGAQASQLGSFSASGLYVPASGAAGQAGTPGGGAGGGGSGGGTSRNRGTLCNSCNDQLTSGGGGGGGAGGCGGQGGQGGRGGGASVALMSMNTVLVVENSRLQTAAGGAGGPGSSGGSGGAGGPGGSGAAGQTISGGCATRTAGAGATGGAGGPGGSGGGGSGGAGGPSVCVVYSGMAPTQSAVDCVAGAGGSGGLGGGGAPNGPNGLSSNVAQVN